MVKVYIGETWDAFGATGGETGCVVCETIMDNYSIDEDDVTVFDDMIGCMRFLCLECAKAAGIEAEQGDRIDVEIEVVVKRANQDR